MDKKTLSRRDFLRLTSAAAAGAVLAGCAPKQAATEQAAPGPKGLTAEDITLRMWHWDNYLAEGYKPVIEKWAAEHPNIKVVIEMTDYGEYSQKVAATIAGGTVPDVTGTIAEHFTNMAGQGQLVDLKPYTDGTKFDLKDYHPGNLSQNSWGGKLLSIPYTADGMWFFYHVDGFKEKGVKTPYEYWKEGNWTWETATMLAEQLSSGEGTDRVFGWGGMSTGNYFEMLPYLASNGSGFFDEQYTKCLLSDPKSKDVYQWGYDNRKFAPGPEDQQTGSPASGRVMMWLDWSPYALVYALSDAMPFKFSFAPPPSSPKTKKDVFCGDAPGFGILKGAKHPDESWAYIEWINKPDSLETVFQLTGTEPPRLSVATDAKLWERTPKYPDSAIGHELTVARFKEGFYNTPKVSNFVEMWQAHNEEISLAWTDEQTLDEALTKATDRINTLLPEGNVDQDKLYWTGS